MTTIQATPTRLRTGAWGATVKESHVGKGDVVTIVTKGGKSWDALVEKVVWSGKGVTIVATKSLDRLPADVAADTTGRPQPSRGAYGYSERRYCHCRRPLDEGDGECMYCGYEIR